MSQIIGKVGMTPRGMYERTRAYERLDVVTYQGSSWVAIVDVPAQISPAMGSDYWQLQARMGETGPQGPVGPQGNSAFMNDGTVNKYELVNNLTQGGENAVLSAEQGKILKQELTELESEVNAKVYSESSFILKEDAAHSSRDDKAFISINKGETFYTRVKMENGSYSQIYAYYADGTSESIQELTPVSDVAYQFVASKDIVAISIYAVAGTGKIWFRAWKDDSIEQDIQNLEQEIKNIEQEIQNLGFDTHVLKFKPQNDTLTKIRLHQPYLKKGRKYRLTLTNPSWDISGVTLTEVYVFGFGYVPKGKTEADYVRLVGIPLALMSTIQPSYEFEVTDDWEFLNIEMRCSEWVYIICEDITEVKALKNELLGAEGFVSKNDLVLNTYAGQYNSANVKDKAKEFCSLLDTDGAVEPFVFFTDTHLYHWNVSEQKRIEALNLIRKYYNSIPANFILCGGDWLTSHKKADALHYLGEIDGIMHKTFDNYYSVFGNHDNNYQGGILNEVRSEGDEGIISNDTMANLWFREYGKMYYYFHGTSTRFFVLDTGIDWESGMTAYRWEQIDWLANLLLTQPSEHNAIAMHIMSLSADFEQGITPMADAVTKLANAYNTRSSIALNGKTYDFASSEGKVHVAICGHSHYDWAGKINGLPTLCTTQFLEGYTGTETFDMIILDYAANKLRTIRVGVGSNRELDI